MEADAVVCTIQAVHENRVAENIVYPTHLIHRRVMVANLYTKIHSFMRNSLCLIGLKNKAVSVCKIYFAHIDIINS